MFDEAACLAVDPFDGDFGSPSDKIFRNKIATCVTREGECSWCYGDIKLGEKYRAIVAKFDGELHTYKYCNKCCAAMAKSEKDGGAAWEKRCGNQNVCIHL